MNLLLIDIGNTYTKIKIFNTSENVYTFEDSIKTNEFIISFDAESKEIMNLTFDKIIYSSVNATASELMNEWIKENKLNNFDIMKSINSEKFVTGTRQIGSDLVAYYYGVEPLNKNVIVASLGTATTINLIIEGKYLGTVIAPGLQISLDNLFEKADLLDQNKYSAEKTNVIVGTTTNQAIWLGAIKGHFLMIKSFIEELTDTYDIDQILITGGNIKHLKELIKETDWEIDEDLLFRGLINLATNN